MHFSALLLALLALVASLTAFSRWAEEEILQRRMVAEVKDAGPQALVAALVEGDRGRSGRLVESGVGLTGRDESGRTPLMLALHAGWPEVAERMIERGADLQATDASGAGVLEFAVRAGENSLVAALLDRGLSPDPPMAGGGSLVAEAVKAGRTASAKMLLDAGASKWGTCEDDGPLIIHATRRGAGWLVERLLASGVRPDAADAQGNSLMHAVVRDERTNLLRLFWKHGIDPDARNEAGETALHVAVLEGRREILPILLEHGASPGSRHPTGWKPLHLALQRGDVGAMRALLAGGANPNSEGAMGRTAMDLVLALESGPEALQLLLEAGVDPGTKGPDGRTPFEVLVARRDFASAQLLVDHGARAEASLHNAVVEGDTEAFDFLLRNQAEADGTSDDPPLVAAVRAGQAGMVARLLKAGASTERAGKEGQPPLHLAVALDRADLTMLLLEAGADANVPFAEPVTEAFLAKVREVGFIKWQFKRDSRITPLMMAVDSGNRELVKALLEHGARKHVWTKRRSYYPIGFAARRDDVKMMQLLLERDPANEERWIKVDLSAQMAHVYGRNGETIFSTRISSGKRGYRTKTGEFVITNKKRHHQSSIYDGASMPYFQRLSCGDFGFHEGYCPGHAASHGCIRVPKGNATQLWKITELGDRVVIVP